MRYKQANNIYIAPKSKIESRAHYAPEPAWGTLPERFATRHVGSMKDQRLRQSNVRNAAP